MIVSDSTAHPAITAVSVQQAWRIEDLHIQDLVVECALSGLYVCQISKLLGLPQTRVKLICEIENVDVLVTPASKFDWASADWSKNLTQIAHQLGCSVESVRQRKLKMERQEKRLAELARLSRLAYARRRLEVLRARQLV